MFDKYGPCNKKIKIQQNRFIYNFTIVSKNFISICPFTLMQNFEEEVGFFHFLEYQFIDILFIEIFDYFI